MSSSKVEARMIGMRRPNRFTIINNRNFAIRPRDANKPKDDPEEQTYSPDLYIKNGFLLDESSPLYKFINMGLIVESTTADNKEGYTAYRFFRPLVDSINFDDNGLKRKKGMEAKPLNPHISDPKIRNENDCLKFGEAMGIAMRYGDIDYVIRHLQTDETDSEFCVINKPTILFGEKERINTQLYKNAGAIDNNAIPQPGEAYAIVRRKVDGKTPYHIAFVIYKAGSINITLEAEAEADREYLPHFAFYDTNPDGYTFHRRWAGLLPGDDEEYETEDDDGEPYTTTRHTELYNNGNTIVLQPTSTPTPTPIPTPSAPVGAKRKRGTGGKSMKKLTLRKQNKNTTIKAK